MSLLGQFTAAIPAVPWAQIKSRHLKSQILLAWDKQNTSLDDQIFLSDETKLSLQWWITPGNLTGGVP